MAKKKETLSQFLSGTVDPTVKTESPETLDQALEEIAKNPGVLGLGGAAEKLLPGASAKEDTEASKALAAGYSPSEVESEIFGKTAPAKKADSKSTAAETKSIENTLSSGPWAQLSESLVKQYDQALSPTEAAVSGSTNASGQADAASQALASLGMAPGSSAGSWLTSQLGAANANAAPVSAAMNAYGSQYAAEAGPITKALQAYGQANELEVSTAPEQSWLNALSSHITSNLSYYGEIPTAAESSIPGGVLQALQQSGGYPGSTGSGLTPLSSLTVGPGGAVKPTKASTTGAATATLGGGSVPGVSPNAGSG